MLQDYNQVKAEVVGYYKDLLGSPCSLSYPGKAAMRPFITKNTIMWAEQVMKGDNLKATLMKLSLALQVASGYYLWLERNERLHRNNYRDVVTVTKGITDMIRSRASRLNKIKATTQNIHLQKQWNPPESIFEASSS
ncbi:unnamed protein product [Ilex paraguariensis]|uniref:Uncharacterized protein n=1 Tax=Ilex paraguariensis TaxID=185542 RepID=A0ABC8TFX8_9AQUA